MYNYIVRPYTESDRELLKNMIMNLYTEDPEGLPMNISKIEHTIGHFLSNPSSGSIDMILSEEDVIGYGIKVNYYSNEFSGNIVHIDELFINQEFRSKGAGEFYVKHIIDDIECRAVMIETTKNNERAKSFYIKLGFIQSENSHFLLKRKEA